MWRRMLTLALPGLAVGLLICGYAGWITRHAAVEANPDAPMAAQFILDVASQPLSLLTGGALYRFEQAMRVAGLWRFLDCGQVLLNCALISAVIVGLGRWLLGSGRDRPPPSESGAPRTP